MTDVLVIDAGPAGVLAALRAADLGAQTVLVTSGALGGMAANDGTVPVRTLAHARLMRVDDLARTPLLLKLRAETDLNKESAQSIAAAQATQR
jgi:pyruvate/2-oxoglutarate dehydrogenase complex dihydrolipoamide dehydrogenase (E3) component